MSEPQGDRINIRVGGDVSGQLTAGRGNVVSWDQTHTPIAEEDLTTLRALFDELRARVEAEGGEQAKAAQEKIDELAEAVTPPEPDLATMEHVPGWFKRRLPALARSVSSLVVHPIVAKLVAAAGDQFTQEFTRRFG